MDSSSRNRIPVSYPSICSRFDVSPINRGPLASGARTSSAGLDEVGAHSPEEGLRLSAQWQPPLIRRYPYDGAGGGFAELAVALIVDDGCDRISVEGAERRRDRRARSDLEIEDVTRAAGEHIECVMVPRRHRHRQRHHRAGNRSPRIGRDEALDKLTFAIVLGQRDEAGLAVEVSIEVVEPFVLMLADVHLARDQ